MAEGEAETGPRGDRSGSGSRAWFLRAFVALVILVSGVALGWAGRTVLAPPTPLPAGRAFSVVAVEQGTVERAVNLNVQAAWAGGSEVVNAASGVLTEVKVASGGSVAAGQVAYTVGLSPVVFAVGSVPAFRDLGVGVKGADVAQLQELLRVAGVRSAGPDGDFGEGTAREVRAWQHAVGMPQTGTVAYGQVVFVPKLPGVVAWAEAAKVGAPLSAGTVVGRILPAEPVFSMALPAGQRALVEPGMEVLIRAGKGQWKARVGSIGEPTQEGTATAQIVPTDGATSVCGGECSTVPITGDAGLSARVIIVPAQQGPVVPSAALAVDAAGSSSVITDDGRQLPVTVTAAAGGRVLVTGVDVGTKVRVPPGAPAGGAGN